jgi:acetyltransferase-like isoleucine patch superfamily enzyme
VIQGLNQRWFTNALAMANTDTHQPWVRLYEGTIVQSPYSVDDFVVIGYPVKQGAAPTKIGANAVIRSHTVIYAGNQIGEGLHVGHGALIRELNVIGDRVSIGSHSIVEHHVTIGNEVRIHSNVFIPEYSILEDDVWIGPHVTLTNARYPQSPTTKAKLKGPHLKSGAIIGAGVVILPGVSIGRKALIGAGAVVVKDVADREVVVGNPARATNTIDSIADYGSR